MLPQKLCQFFTYAQRFDIIPQFPFISGSNQQKGRHPDPITGLFALKRAKRSNGTLLGGIIPLEQVRALVEVTPRFGKEADRRLAKGNSRQYCSEFWLDKYFTKELFYAVHNTL